MSILKTLNNWERKSGRCWYEELQRIASTGGTWKTAADQFGVSRTGLIALCKRRGFEFEWKCINGQVPNVYWYRGKRRTLKELSTLSGLKITTIYYRIHQKKYTVVQAVERPVMSRSECGRRGGEALRRVHEQKSKAKRTQANRVAHATHGTGTTGNMGRTECPS